MKGSDEVDAPIGRPQRGWRLGQAVQLEPVWYAGLVLLLCTDLTLRNTDADLPLSLVLTAWSAAFLLPFLAVSFLKRARR